MTAPPSPAVAVAVDAALQIFVRHYPGVPSFRVLNDLAHSEALLLDWCRALGDVEPTIIPLAAAEWVDTEPRIPTAATFALFTRALWVRTRPADPAPAPTLPGDPENRDDVGRRALAILGSYRLVAEFLEHCMQHADSPSQITALRQGTARWRDLEPRCLAFAARPHARSETA